MSISNLTLLLNKVILSPITSYLHFFLTRKISQKTTITLEKGKEDRIGLEEDWSLNQTPKTVKHTSASF